jgi:hypothetical protein
VFTSGTVFTATARCSGDLPGIKAGPRRWRIRKSDMAEYLSSERPANNIPSLEVNARPGPSQCVL